MKHEKYVEPWQRLLNLDFWNKCSMMEYQKNKENIALIMI